MYDNSSLPKPMTRRQFLGRSLTLGITAVFCGDIFFFEPQSPVLASYEIAMPNLPRELEGFRIVQLSDIHRRGITPDSVIKRAVNMANSTHADIAVLTGDFVGKDLDDIEPCFEMLEGVKTRLGSYAVLGNHDHWLDAGAVSRGIIKHGITLLNNDNIQVARGLYLVGIDDAWVGEPDVDRAYDGVNDDACCVILSHIPKGIDLFQGRKGLLLSGHTHGGQVQLPSLRRAPGPGGHEYISGWYRRGDILMYISRGIGMSILPMRFRCRPEVTLFTLHQAKDHRVSLMDTKD